MTLPEQSDHTYQERAMVNNLNLIDTGYTNESGQKIYLTQNGSILPNKFLSYGDDE